MALGIPTIEQARRSLAGAWQLFLGRNDGMALLDTSFGGFWRSFGVVFLLAPLNVIFILTEMRIIQDTATEPGTEFPLVAFSILNFLDLGVELIAFPLLLAALSGFLSVRATFVPYVVARNWSLPIADCAALCPALLYAVGVINLPIAQTLLVAAIVVTVRLRFVILRIALQVSIGTAIALVILDVVLSLVLSELIIGASGIV